jgi:hypothetical protein
LAERAAVRPEGTNKLRACARLNAWLSSCQRTG